MSVRSLNKVMLIGNLTRDPNLRFTPSGTAVCSFGLATNRSWSTESGEKEERVDFHNVVSWAKLAEISGQLLHKGDKVYVEGRIQTRDWKTNDGADRRITEIIIDNMILLPSSRRGSYSGDTSSRQANDASGANVPANDTSSDDASTNDSSDDASAKDDASVKKEVKPSKAKKKEKTEEVSEDEIPF